MGDLQVGGISIHPSNITPQLHTCFCLQPSKVFNSFSPKVCFSLMVLGLNIFFPPGRKWNVVVVSFCIQCILGDAVFFLINWVRWFCEFFHPAGGLFFFLVVFPQQQANFQKNSYPPVGAFFDWICLFPQRRWNFTRWFLLCHIFGHGLHHSFGHVWSMYRSSHFRSTLNTGYITALDMSEICAEAVHSVALWTRVTSRLWTCVKYVPKQSIP